MDAFKNYWKILSLIAIFYFIPSFQFIFYQQNKDICRFNYKCMHQILFFKAGNNVISNIGYIILGLIHVICVKKKFKKEKIKYKLQNNQNELQIKKQTDEGLHLAMGLGLILEGIFSSLYHVCPSMQNYQFDSTFIIIGSGMITIDYIWKLNYKLQFDFFKVYGFFAALVCLNLFN